MASSNNAFDLIPPFAEPAYLSAIHSPYYNSTHHALRSKVRAHLDKHVLPHMLSWEAAGEVPESATQAWRATGLAHTMIPSSYRAPHQRRVADVLDTDKLDVFHELVLIDETSRLEGGVGVGLDRSANVIGLPPVLHHGSAAQKQRWLPGVLDGSVRFCLAITEPSGGSDVGNVVTTATRDGDAYIVRGAKKWITGAPWATHATTAVRTGGPGVAGLSLLVIPLQSPGVTVRRIANSGQSAGGASWIELRDVRVPADHLLGREGAGFKMIMTNFNRERFALAVGCNRKARTCLAHAWSYARDRETFGAPLLDRQAIRHKLLGVAEKVESHWAWLEQLAWHVQASPARWLDTEVAGRMALCKVQGGQLLERAAREAQQVMGGVAYQKGGVGGTVEQITRDLRMMVVGGGSEEILMDLAFKQEENKFLKKEAGAAAKI